MRKGVQLTIELKTTFFITQVQGTTNKMLTFANEFIFRRSIVNGSCKRLQEIKKQSEGELSELKIHFTEQ